MSIKSVLSLSHGHPGDLPVLDRAFAFAHAARADLRIVHLSPPAVLPDMSAGGLYGGLGFADTTALDIVDAQAMEVAAKAQAQVEALCTRFGMPFHQPGAAKPVGQAAATFRAIAGNPRQCLPAQARTVDLMITGYDTAGAGDMEMVLAGLFTADCPVLAVPRTAPAASCGRGYADTVVVGWDDSRASARALRGAVPHMLRASDVYFVHVAGADETAGDDIKSDLVAYLRSHCLIADFISVDCQGRKVGAALLAEAKRLGADLLAMGAYGHNHIGEMILGGVTDHVLKHADIPLLLTH